MKIITADNNGTGHFGGDNAPSEDATPDRNLTGKWTLLVLFALIIYEPLQRHNTSTRTNISSANCFRWGLETKPDILVPPLLLRRHLLSTYPSHIFCG